MVSELSVRPLTSASVYVYVTVTAVAKESSSVTLLMSALTSKAMLAALERLLFGLPMEESTVLESKPLICMTMVDEVAVKFAGVTTRRLRLSSESVVVAAELTVTGVEVEDDGDALPAQPDVVKLDAEEVAEFPAASRETVLKLYSVQESRLLSALLWLATRVLVSVSVVVDA